MITKPGFPYGTATWAARALLLFAMTSSGHAVSQAVVNRAVVNQEVVGQNASAQNAISLRARLLALHDQLKYNAFHSPLVL